MKKERISLKNMEPLTAEEKAFSADLENYNLFFKYMKINKLDQEEWYDILILHYLRAVKKYLNIPHLQQYKFSTILFKSLDSAGGNYYNAMTVQKRKPEGGTCSLDLVIEGDNGREQHIESWFIDHKVNVEKQVIFKELFQEFYRKCITIIDDFDEEAFTSEYLKCELDLLLEGYSEYQTWKKTEKQYPYGYTLYNLQRDIDGFRQIFKEVFGF
ncbi:MAG: hypothetical protein NC433_09730 [Clostridiales bacterium]|nr:hypothetical protein [Clostridiales bacterium]